MGGDYLYDWVKTVWGVDLIEESLKTAVGLPCRPVKSPEPAVHLVGLSQHHGINILLFDSGIL